MKKMIELKKGEQKLVWIMDLKKKVLVEVKEVKHFSYILLDKKTGKEFKVNHEMIGFAGDPDFDKCSITTSRIRSNK